MGGASAGRVSKKKTRSRQSTRTERAPMNRISRSSAKSSIKTVFERFKDEKEDKIGPEGMLSFFSAVSVDPLDIVTLIFAWKLNAKIPFEFSRTEFVDGCLALGCETIEKLKRTIRTFKLRAATLESQLSQQGDFRKFYMFSFDYNKPPEQRSLPLDTAKQLFPLILKGRFKHMELWLEFLETRKHAITRDTYSLLLDFSQTIENDLSNYDEENGAWPVMLDEFVDFARPKLGVSKKSRCEDDDMDEEF